MANTPETPVKYHLHNNPTRSEFLNADIRGSSTLSQLFLSPLFLYCAHLTQLPPLLSPILSISCNLLIQHASSTPWCCPRSYSRSQRSHQTNSRRSGSGCFSPRPPAAATSLDCRSRRASIPPASPSSPARAASPEPGPRPLRPDGFDRCVSTSASRFPIHTG